MDIKKSAGAWVPAFILYDPLLTLEEKITYCFIHNLCDDEGKCHPSNTWLSKVVGKGERSIKRYITNLKAKGLIHTTMQKSATGCHRVIYVTNSVKGGGDTSVTRGRANLAPIINNNTNGIINSVWLLSVFNTIRKSALPNTQGLKTVGLETEVNIRGLNDAEITQEELEEVIVKCFNDPMHKEKMFKYVTPEYVTRTKTVNRYLYDETL